MKRQLEAVVANRLDDPGPVFGDKLEEVNTSSHYTSQPLTAERVNALDRAKMMAFYKQRFSNAADFTFFMVGAFKLDEALPLLARYVGGLPSTGTRLAVSRTSGSTSPRPSKQREGREGTRAARARR